MALSLFTIILAYFFGSICSAVIVCRLFGLPDPRQEGSQNPGATNVLRIAGKKYAILVLVADLLKGFIPVLIARLIGFGPGLMACTVLAAVLGHIYPVFFGFKGGKGVATAIGALFAFNFLIALMASLTWIFVARVSLYSSLASIVSISLIPFYTLISKNSVNAFLPLFLMVLIIIYQHRNNIRRLMDGSESKIKLSRNLIREWLSSSRKN